MTLINYIIMAVLWYLFTGSLITSRKNIISRMQSIKDQNPFITDAAFNTILKISRVIDAIVWPLSLVVFIMRIIYSAGKNLINK